MDSETLAAWKAAQESGARTKITEADAGTFKLFPDFPIEIRDEIWKHSVPTPEVLAIKFEKMNCDDETLAM